MKGSTIICVFSGLLLFSAINQPAYCQSLTDAPGVLTEEQIEKFVELSGTAQANPTGLIFLGQTLFRQGAVLPVDYRDMMNQYFVAEEYGEVHFTFLDVQGEYGAYSIKLIVDAYTGTVKKFDAFGKRFIINKSPPPENNSFTP